jgi:catechol 2,3-dioxygenase-like lactoylglutathione lyase family enzyme
MNTPFKKVAFTVYSVKDMKRSREFYEKTLGFKPGDDFEGTWQEYDMAGTTFAIATAIGEWVKPGSQQSVAFEVTDLKSVVKDLQGKKVPFDLINNEMILETPFCWMAFIKDPDGNGISLHQCR